jgi:outer membrane protein assembly factor BamD
MPEAAEAQLKVANIHYNEMEKPDRDFTHAMRAEEEYRALIQEYPDSKVVPQAKQRLREVQEVLAQREYNIGRFYFLRQSYPAAIARLKTLVDRYPLYSGADEALYLLGQSYEGEIAMVRANGRATEIAKTKLIEQFTKDAAEQYSKIITRYPAMDRAVDAKDRLEALHQTVPRPTRAALELNKKEMASREQCGTMASVVGTFEKHPDVCLAAHMGEPTMQDHDPVTATDVVKRANQALMGGGDNTVKAQAVSGPLQSQEVPRSGAQPTETAAPQQPAEQPAAAAPDQPNPAAGELKPSVAADPNELKPNVAPDANQLPPPTQTNEIQPGDSSTPAKAGSSSSKDDLVDISSSRKKKKKGLAKLKPF